MARKLLMLVAGLSGCFSLNAFADATPSGNWKNPTVPATTPAPAPGGLTGNFDITSNYMFRGISNSNNLPAVQGGFTYTFSSTGVYFNLWGSNVYFPDTQGNTATLELDTIAGIANPIGDHFKYNLSLARYNYPKSSSSYPEVIGSAQWYFLTALIGHSSNIYGYHDNGTYYNVGINYDIPPPYFFQFENINLTAGIGHYSLPARQEMSSYNDYSIAISKTLGNYVLSVQWTDTGNSSFSRANDPAAPVRGSHFLVTALVNF